MDDFWKITGSVLVVLAVASAIFWTGEDTPQGLEKFSSYEQLQQYVKEGMAYSYSGNLEGFATGMVATAAGVNDFSATNIQVEGVDEADIVKTDGKYLYLASGRTVVIMSAYPPESAAKISEIEMSGRAQELYVNNDRLVVFGNSPEAFIRVYDISDRARPVLARELKTGGRYFTSRMIGDYVYAVINTPIYQTEPPLPVITQNWEKREVKAEKMYYYPQPGRVNNYVNIIAVNVHDDSEEYTSTTVLGNSAQNIYVSEGNIYLTQIERESTAARGVPPETPVVFPVFEPAKEKTVIHRFSLNQGSIKYAATGSVPGRVLNQFSMDEYEENFRIATTEGRVARTAESATSTNNVYVLDPNLDILGKIENLAPGEKIYSARFMGKRAYVVTFRKVDPLFVIDLSEPTSPKVLGKLKIPGYSDYLHPYDENHIIGVGKNAVAAEQGDFAWYQGLKLALFDVSDPAAPKEIAKAEIGDRGTDSYALRDHKAFLFDREKNLLVIPVLLAEIEEEKYAGTVPSTAYGSYVWQGAYVYHLDAVSGFELRGKVSHASDDELLKSGHYFYSQGAVKRALYIEDTLYTLSDRMVKANALAGLAEISRVYLQ